MSIVSYPLTYYRNLIQKSFPIISTTFPRKITSKKQLDNYIHFDRLTKNIKIPNKIPLETYNSCIADALLFYGR